MCVQCLYVQNTSDAASATEANLHGLTTCVMSPYPRTKSACCHPCPPPPAHRQRHHTGRRAAPGTTSTARRTTCTTGTTTTKSEKTRRRHPQPPPPRHPGSSHQIEGSLALYHLPEADCHQVSPSPSIQVGGMSPSS